MSCEFWISQRGAGGGEQLWASLWKKEKTVWQECAWPQNATCGDQAQDDWHIISSLCTSVIRSLCAATEESGSLPSSKYYRRMTLPERAIEHPGCAWLTEFFPHSVQIKASTLWPSFVNSIFVLSFPGSLVVCSWTVFWEAFLLPHWDFAMIREEPQSHRMPPRERKERHEENKLACPKLHNSKTKNMDLWLLWFQDPLPLK